MSPYNKKIFFYKKKIENLILSYLNGTKKKLEKIINQRKTLLGVGPMSLNVVDASIELSNKFNFPLMMIASRRQIDSKDFGEVM